MKGIIITYKGELSDEAKIKLKKMEEEKRVGLEKLVEDYRTEKFNMDL